MGVLFILGGLAAIAFGAYFIWYTRTINNAPWYGTYTQYIYCYIFPGLTPFLGSAAIVTGFDRLGTPLPQWLATLIIAPTFPLALVGFIGILGITLPGFLTPRWIRERERQDRAQRRARRRANRQTRREA